MVVKKFWDRTVKLLELGGRLQMFRTGGFQFFYVMGVGMGCWVLRGSVTHSMSCLARVLALCRTKSPTWGLLQYVIFRQQLGAPAHTWQQYPMWSQIQDLQRQGTISEERNFAELIKASAVLEATLVRPLLWESLFSVVSFSVIVKWNTGITYY